MRTRPIIAAICISTLAGCAVGPNYVRPSVTTPAAFKEAEGWTRAVPADTLDRGDWWSLFNDPVLDDLERQVEVSNQNLAAAEAAYRQASAVVREQRAAFFPTVSVDGAGKRANSLAGGASTTSTTANTYQFDLDASWTPDVWGAIRRTVENASANAQASAADLANARLSAQGQLAVAYFQLRQADVAIDLLQKTVAGYERSLKIAQNRYAVGVDAKSDVLQAQTQLANAQSSLASQRLARAQSEHAIAVLIGKAPADFSLAATPTRVATVPDIPVVLPSTLLQRRPDIAAAERLVAAANAQIGVAEAAYFPTLTLSGNNSTAASKLSELFAASTSFWAIGAAVAETIFDGGLRGSRVAAAKAAHDQAVAQYRQTTLAAFQNVEDQLAGTRILAQQTDLLAQASRSADQAETISLNQYKAGLIAYTDVVVIQATALSARIALSQAQGSRQTTAVALIQSLGGGWSAPPPSS